MLKTKHGYTEAVFQWSTVKKDVFKSFAKFTGKQLCWSLIFNRVARSTEITLLERDSCTSVSCEGLLLSK